MISMSGSDILARSEALGLPIDPESADRISIYTRHLETWSAKINLVGPKAKEFFWENHLAEAIWLSSLIRNESNLADIGSGGGLPGLVLAALEPDREISLIEPRAKRHTFLTLALAEMGLSRVEVIRSRIDPANPWRKRFGTVVSRASAAWPVQLGLAKAIGLDGAEVLLLLSDKALKEIEERFSVGKCDGVEFLDRPTLQSNGLEFLAYRFRLQLFNQ